MNYEKKVSICMMVKNEEKNLYRCLNSLQPIIDSGLAELIVVDTGSDDSTIEIAKQYTEKVFEHSWEDNFSEMRNITMSYAKGEWIWIIDADEEIENPNEMICLFEKDLSEYNTIITTMKNYMETPTEDKEPDYNISILKRGFRNTKSFKFVGAVHNQPMSQEPSFKSDIIFGHYGYIWADKEFARKKFERTSGILKKELKKDPKNIYYQFQLAVSWSNIDKSRSLIEMRKAYNLIHELPLNKRFNYLYVYGVYARIAYQNKSYSEVIRICNEGLKFSEEYIDLWYLGGISFEAIKDDENSLTYLQKFLELKGNFRRTKISKDPSFTFYHLDDFSENLALYQISFLMCKQEKYDNALQYINKMSPCDLKTNIVTRVSNKSKNYDLLSDYMGEIYDDEKIKVALIQNIENLNIEEEYRKGLYQSIVEIYEKFDDNGESYYLLNKARLHLIENIEVDELFMNELLILNYDDLADFYGDIIFYLLREKIHLKELGNIGRIENINRFSKYVLGKYNEYFEVLSDYVTLYENIEETNCIRYWIVLARHILLSKQIDNEKYEQIFKRYIEKGMEYIFNVYNRDILENEMIYDVKNDEHRFFLYLIKANKYKEKDKKRYINYLREALRVYPMEKGVKLLLNKVKDSKNNDNEEMDNLKKQFKKNIKSLIENKMIDQAEELIKQYEQLIDGDEEVLLFKSQINLMKLERDSDSGILN